MAGGGGNYSMGSGNAYEWGKGSDLLGEAILFPNSYSIEEVKKREERREGGR